MEIHVLYPAIIASFIPGVNLPGWLWVLAFVVDLGDYSARVKRHDAVIAAVRGLA